METQDKWRLVSLGSITRCEFCDQSPVEYLMISTMDGHIQSMPIFLCDNHRNSVIHNVIYHNQVTPDAVQPIKVAE